MLQWKSRSIEAASKLLNRDEILQTKYKLTKRFSRQIDVAAPQIWHASECTTLLSIENEK